MDIRDLLKQYTELKKEIEDLKREIAKLEATQMGIVSDKVKASCHVFPYTEVDLTIKGYDYQGADRREEKLWKRRGKLKLRLIDLEDIVEEIDEFICSIPNSRTRRVFRLRYMDRKGWKYIARQIGAYNESVPRMIVERYLDSLKQNI